MRERTHNTGRKCMFCDLPATAPAPPIGPPAMRRPRLPRRLRETQPERSLQPRKKRKMAIMTRILVDWDGVGLGDAPHMGLRSGEFKLVAR